MTELSGPFDNGNWGEDGWANAAPSWAPDCVVPGVDNELLVVANGGLQTALQFGNAWMKGFGYRNQDAFKVLNHAASAGTAGQSRNDLVVLRLDRAANTIVAMLITGVFSATPADPALIQVTDPTKFDMPIARVNVVANASAVGTITMIRKFYQPGLPQLLGQKTSLAVTPTTTTEAMDAGVGFITFTVTDARHWHKIRYKCTPNIDASSATLIYTRLRDSGSSANPTTASTLLQPMGIQVLNVLGAPGQIDCVAEGKVQLAVGTHTIGGSYARIGGSTNVNLSTVGPRELSVENVGYLNPQ